MKAKEKLENRLISIYKKIDGYYPDTVPNEIESMHYDGAIELTKSSDIDFNMTITLLTTAEEHVVDCLDIEFDDDDLVDGWYLDEYLEHNDIDIADHEEQVELEIHMNIKSKEIQFEEYANHSSTIWNLQKLSEKIEEDTDFIHEAVECIVEEYPETSKFFREEKIDAILSESTF